MVSLRRAVAAGAAATIAGGLVTGVVVYHAVHPSGQAGEIYDVLRQADSISQKYFVGEDYDTDDLINGALTGYAQGLGDRWTSYMTPEYYQSYRESSADSTVGIGVTVSYLENDDGTHYLYVNTVATDSPAQKAGIGCYDKITAINGKRIDDFGSYDKAVAPVRGKAGGVVQLGIHQYATNQDVTLSVTRAEYEQIHVTSRMLDNQIGYIRIEKFADNTDEQFDAPTEQITSPIPVLYQSGYLTIKGYDRNFQIYRLAYPNGEVRKGFIESLLPSYVHLPAQNNTFYVVSFLRDLMKGDVESCLERTRSFFASIPNDLENKTEKHYQTIFYLLFRLMGQYVESEVKSSVGRADVVVQLQDVVYVFEFKYDGTPEEALAQIDSKQYAIPYRADGRRVVKIGVNFDSATRTIGGWKIAKAD